MIRMYISDVPHQDLGADVYLNFPKDRGYKVGSVGKRRLVKVAQMPQSPSSSDPQCPGTVCLDPPI